LREILYCKEARLSNPLANSFHKGYTIKDSTFISVNVFLEMNGEVLGYDCI
jgi:hypothetical protein